MVKYENWKWTNGEQVGPDRYIAEINIGELSWYDLMEDLDKQGERVVVGVSSDGRVNWFTDGRVSGVHAPSDGTSVVVVDSVPFTQEDYRHFILVGNEFQRKESTLTPRTKEDIMADLIKLQEELKAMA